MKGARLIVGTVLCASAAASLAGCSVGLRGGTAASSGVLPEGLAYIKDGVASVIRGGAPVEVRGHGAPQTGVAYDAEGDGLLVTESSGAAGRTVRLVKPSGARVLLTTQDGSLLGSVRFSERRSEGLYALDGQPRASLRRFSAAEGAVAATSGAPVKLPVAAATEFDIGPNGTTLVYTTDTAEPMQLVVMDGDAVRFTNADLAYAFTPSISRDGKKVCFTGMRHTGDPVGIWTLDLASRELTEVVGTPQYAPSFPVFSPDGRRIAFRDAQDGSVRIVSASGGSPEKLPLAVDDAALDW